MKLLKTCSLVASLIILSFVSFADSPVVSTIEAYNNMLPFWGVSWSPGVKSIDGYYPSFYTGFAMRSEFPERIHIRVSRGNQVRLSVVLDDQTLTDYTFDLAARYNFYKKMTTGPGSILDIKPKDSSFLPYLSYFNQVLESSTYNVLSFVNQAKLGGLSSEEIYANNLNTLRALNPGRVFILNLNLTNAFNAWKAQVQQDSAGNIAKITGNPQATVTAINNLLFGRINYTQKPSADVMAKLAAALTAAVQEKPQDEFIATTLDLFKTVTGTKYDFKVVNSAGQWQKALQCSSAAACVLSYPEFTAIYPTGSVMEKTSDEFGNSINSFATPGLWQFVARPGKSDVDNIRNEPYYAFIPKMDFQAIGNGFHNPGLRFWDPSKALKQALNLGAKDDTYWAVKRGGVSHGCLRLAPGHVWEMRHILPVESEKMTHVNMFGSRPQDFDVFDIDGSGQLKVMGVQYFISYDLQGTSETAQRQGADLQINADKKLEFYTNLYGATNVFSVTADGQFVFSNPHISMPSYLDFQRENVSTKFTLQGDYPLYEQTYEKDKIQLYAIPAMQNGTMSQENKMLARLMGRVRGCAPTSDKKACGQTAFETEMQGMVR